MARADTWPYLDREELMNRWTKLLRNLLLIGLLATGTGSISQPVAAAGCQEITGLTGAFEILNGCWYCESGDCWTLTCAGGVDGGCS